MLKAKFCSFAIACIIGLIGFSPITAFAAETDTEATLLSEEDKEQDKKAAFQEKMIAASEKWSTLSSKQKNEVYSLIEKEMKAKFKIMDKYVNLGIITKEDADHMETRMKEKFIEMKKSGELPLLKYRIKKQSN